MATTTAPSTLQSSFHTLQQSHLPEKTLDDSPLTQRSLHTSSVLVTNVGMDAQGLGTSRSTIQKYSGLQDNITAKANSDPLSNPVKESSKGVIPLDALQARISQEISSGVGPDHLVKSGWLYKRGKRKTWKRRWFVLRDSQLVYYKDDKEYKPKDIISTSDIMAVAMLTDEHKPNHFAFFAPTKNYHLRAETTQEAESWVHVLKVALEQASQEVLSSSYKRLPTFDGLNANNDFKSPLNYRHSMIHSSQPHDGPTSIQSDTSNSNTPSQEVKSKRHTMHLGMLSPTAPSTLNEPSLPVDSQKNKQATPSATLDTGSSFSKSVTSELSGTSNPSNLIYSGNEDLGRSSCASELSSSPLGTPITKEQDSTTVKGDQVPSSSLVPPVGQQHHERQPSDISAIEFSDEEDNNNLPDGKVLKSTIENEQILKEGYMLRLKKRYKHWRKQWIVLTNERILFYKTNKSTSPLKVIPLENLIDVVEQDAMSKSKQFCMQLITPEKRMKFCAPTEEDLVVWLAVIKSVIDESPKTASILP